MPLSAEVMFGVPSAVRAGQEAGMGGTRIVLVDDVYTTGATL